VQHMRIVVCCFLCISCVRGTLSRHSASLSDVCFEAGSAGQLVNAAFFKAMGGV
jgi:hypothetical protein